MDAGDTLYVCGTHVRTLLGRWSIASQGLFMPTVSGTATNPIVISGDYPGDTGLLFNAYRDERPGGITSNGWVEIASGVYSNATEIWDKVYGSPYDGIDGTNHLRYTWLSSTAEVLASGTNGVYYTGAFGTNRNYVVLRPFNESTFRDALRFGGSLGGWRVVLAEHVSHVRYEGLWFMAQEIDHQTALSDAGPYHDYTFKDCRILGYGKRYIYRPYNSYNMTFDGTEFAYGGNGIYVIWNYGSIHHLYVRNCYFHDIGKSWVATGTPDAHGIGIQNNEHFYFTSNRFERCGSAIDFHVGGTKSQRHCHVIGNWIANMLPDEGGVSQGAGIVFEGSNDCPKGNTEDMLVAGNVITNCVSGH